LAKKGIVVRSKEEKRQLRRQKEKERKAKRKQVWKAPFTRNMIFIIQHNTGLPYFSLYNIPEREKIYQITIKYTKLTQNRPNGPKIDQMDPK
jgi:hypothetical protein